jgi:hypothetical protein
VSHLIVFQIVHRGTDRVHVEIVAANKMTFDVLIAGHQDYGTLIADICEIAPLMMRYDTDMAEAFDDGFRTEPQASDRHKINFFVRKYRDRIKNAHVGFGEFTELEGSAL